MAFVVKRMEVEGPSIVAIASTVNRYPELWQAQNDAERLARGHSSHGFDQEHGCWHGIDTDGRTFRYVADRTAVWAH